MDRKNAWTTYTKKDINELEAVCKEYLNFLDEGKTERECVKNIVKIPKISVIWLTKKIKILNII